MIWVYALASLARNYIYVGATIDLDNRILRHTSGREKTTKPYRPFVLIYKEECKDRQEARVKEKFWKSGIGKEKLRKVRNRFIPDI